MKITFFVILSAIIFTSSYCSSLSKIQLTPSAATLFENEEKAFIAEGFDKKGKRVRFNPTWSMDTGGESIGTLRVYSPTQASFQSRRYGVALVTVQEKEIKTTAKIFIIKKKKPHMPQK